MLANATQGGKGLFQLIGHSPSPRKLGQELETETGGIFLVDSLIDPRVGSLFSQDHLPRDWCHSQWTEAPCITQSRPCSVDMTIGSLIWEIPQLRPLSGVSRAVTKNILKLNRNIKLFLKRPENCWVSSESLAIRNSGYLILFHLQKHFIRMGYFLKSCCIYVLTRTFSVEEPVLFPQGCMAPLKPRFCRLHMGPVESRARKVFTFSCCF